MAGSKGHTGLTLDVGCSEETNSAKGGGHCVEVWQELADGQGSLDCRR
jgi:hypothetical protein